MSSHHATPDNSNENLGSSPGPSPTEPISPPMSRKRPRGGESPRYDTDSTIDDRGRSFSFASESRGVRGTCPTRGRVPRKGRHCLTAAPRKTDAVEVNIQNIPATADTDFDRGDNAYDTGGSPHTLPPSFRDPLNRLRQELRDLDRFFLRGLRSRTKHHVDYINEQLKIMENSCRSLHSDFCNQRDQKQKLQDRLTRLQDQTEAATQENAQAKREIEQLKQTTARLQNSIKDLEKDKVDLHNSIKGLEDINKSLKSENEKLEAVVQDKNAEIEVLKASPLSVPPGHTMPVVADAGDHHTDYKYDQLGFGITTFVGSLPKIGLPQDQPSAGRRLNPVLTEFMFNLGSFADRADVAVSPVEGFWRLELPWTPKPPRHITLPSKIDEQFVKLCLLIPYLKSRSRDEISCAIVRLIISLMKADHSSAPHAGMAFLAAMRSTKLAAEVQNLDIQNTALAIALCEFCRFLQETFTELPHTTWDIGNILGSEAQGSLKATPLGRLSTGLANLHRSDTLALRKRLTTACGDKFCFVSVDKRPEGKEELGFLSCNDRKTFLLLDFGGKSIRFVDRTWAYALHQGGQSKHLVIKGPGDVVPLKDIPDAPHDVRIFWVQYLERP